MDSKNPTDILEAEHQVIQKIVGAMAWLAGRDWEQGPTEPPVEDAPHHRRVHCATFADKCHHGKEEVHLFPFLEKRGFRARGCPGGASPAPSHEQGRDSS